MVVLTCSLSLAALPQAQAQESQTRPQADPSSQEGAQDEAQEQLNALSDTQLTNLAADWSSLDEAQRSLLIQETQERMQPKAALKPREGLNRQTASLPSPQAAQQSSQRPSQETTQQTTQRRRYGRLIRKADGSVVRSVVQIETRTVRVQEGDRRRAYGMGFEQRQAPKYPTTLTPVGGSSTALPGGSELSGSSN